MCGAQRSREASIQLTCAWGRKGSWSCFRGENSVLAEMGVPQQHREDLGPQAELGGPKSLRARGWDDAACQQSPAYSLTSSPHSSFPLLDKKDLVLPTFTPHKRMCLPVLLQNGRGQTERPEVMDGMAVLGRGCGKETWNTTPSAFVTKATPGGGTMMTGSDASSSSWSSEGRSPFLPQTLLAAGWQSVLSIIWVRVAGDCPLCVPLGHMYRP